MTVVKRIIAAALACLLLPAAAAAGANRPRPSDVEAAETAMAPNGFQLYNDFASPEHTYPSRSVVVHYVVLGIDAPPLNDDDLDAVPDYVERIGEAADRALAYYERRGFHLPRPDAGGPDARPDVYISRFAPGTLGVAFPSNRAKGGAFVVVANNLDPSAERSFASLQGTVAHELFHLVQFSYFSPAAEPQIATWILEGTATALESRVNTDLDDIVSTIQLRGWFAGADRGLASQSYGAQLFWRYFDVREPAFLPALFGRLARHPVAGEAERTVRSTYTRVSGRPFAQEFHRFALATAAEHAREIEPAATVRPGGTYRSRAVPFSVHYLRVVLPRATSHSFTVRFPSGREGASATLTYQLESDVAGERPQIGYLVPRTAERGRKLTFALPAALLRSPRLAGAVLVITNGGPSAVVYSVSAR